MDKNVAEKYLRKVQLGEKVPYKNIVVHGTEIAEKFPKLPLPNRLFRIIEDGYTTYICNMQYVPLQIMVDEVLEKNTKDLQRFLFFDTETNGLPLKYKAPASDLDNWPRIVSIGWIVYDGHGKELKAIEYIAKPDGWAIPTQASDVHGITDAVAEKEGIPIAVILNEFSKDVQECQTLVAHNMSFDEKIVGAEFIRAGIEDTTLTKSKVCTMLSTVDFCDLPGKFGKKWPTLTELHTKLFGVGFEDAHSAIADIQATGECYWELRRLGEI